MRKVLNNRILLFIAAILLLANITMLFYFLKLRDQTRHTGSTERSKPPINLFLEKEIGFDTAQMKKFEDFRQIHRKKTRPLFEDIRLAKVQFYGYLSMPGTPDTTLEKAASMIGQKQTIADLQTFKNYTEIRSLCTAEQKPRYDSLIAGEIGKMWFPSWREKERQKKESGRRDTLHH